MGKQSKKISIFFLILLVIFIVTHIDSKDDKQEEKNVNGIEVSTDYLKDEEYLIQNLTEEQFKEKCEEIIYNDIDENSVGNYVYKDLVFWEEEREGEYNCGALENFNEELKTYQHSYRVYRIIDSRFDKIFPIENNDIIRVYGIVEKVSGTNRIGYHTPTIKVYYIDYIRKYGEEVEEKELGEIISERYANYRQKEEEQFYRDTLNTDYTGETKNVDGMNELSLDEYILHCDKMNYSNLYSGEDYTGRYVCIHAKLFKQKIFKNDDGKNNRIGDWANAEDVLDTVWQIELYSEQAKDYVTDFGLLYFLDIENLNPESNEREQDIILYGQIIVQPEEDYDDWEFIVRYYEIGEPDGVEN